MMMGEQLRLGKTLAAADDELIENRCSLERWTPDLSKITLLILATLRAAKRSVPNRRKVASRASAGPRFKAASRIPKNTVPQNSSGNY
jgi:hypothetical protein